MEEDVSGIGKSRPHLVKLILDILISVPTLTHPSTQFSALDAGELGPCGSTQKQGGAAH
jgi:hypothetical protein